MNRSSARAAVVGSVVAVGLMVPGALHAEQNGSIYTQCPGDANGDGIPDPGTPGYRSNVRCMHLAAGDGFITMADATRPAGRKQVYTFGFSDVTGLLPSEVVNGNGPRPDGSPTGGLAAANYPAPTIHLREGQEFFLSLTNVGMILRPDLFDPHSVHFHGFPQAASVFDGVPESSATINMGSTFTYYYKIVDGLAGTYMYHCHVEATEHIQMGMVGQLYIDPRQNDTPYSFGGRTFTKFAYNDGDGSTGYDVEYPIQLGSLDSNFHDQHIAIQPLPFAAMDDDYPLLNGRGYPDTVDTGVVYTDAGFGNLPSQPLSSRIVAAQGQRVLLRLSNLAVTRFYTLGSTIPMHVVGHNAKLLRGPDPDGPQGALPAKALYYETNSVTLGGGESVDVILDLDPSKVAKGTYLLYTTNLNYLSNGAEDFGGMMTEITVN
jgi:FtsP/CotA-like multicopper oxidase with cupredoxin domain